MAATDIAIVGYAQTPSVRTARESEVQLLVPIVTEALARAGLDRREIGFTCAGSCDYLTGGPFAFVSNLEAAGAWPPISESHVEMDGAWALYEAWVRLQHGDIDTALVFGSGKSSPSKPDEMWAQQLDPYYLAPLGVDPVSLAGIQARALLDAGKATERDFAEVVVAQPAQREGQPERAGHRRLLDVDALLEEPYVRAPLRTHDLPPISDGAVAVVLATRRPGPGVVRAPGVDPGHRPPHRGAPARHARSHVVAVDHAGGAQGRLRRRPARRRRAVGDVQPAGADPARGARPRRPTRT